MCGISGLITPFPKLSHAKATLLRISQHQLLRGPDHQGLTEISLEPHSLLLAHNRLKIIDLSDAANQPLWDSTGQFCVSFNGEIYNYIELKQELTADFKTQSDTEVILNAYKAWGIACLNKFNGPFAFALYDKTEQSLYLCRDRFGKKPLFYCWHQNNFYFASSAKALAQVLNLQPNLNYVAKGLHYWVYEDDTDITPYEGLMSLSPGCYLKIKLSDLQTEHKRYYDLAQAVAAKKDEIQAYTYPMLIETLAGTLKSAIHIRLRSDVPLAISLSGGLDSTMIAALTAAEQTHLQSFTFGHPEQHATEAPLVANFVTKQKILPNYIAPHPTQFAQALFTTLQMQEAPFPSLSIVAQNLVYQAAKAKNIKVLLGGQGGDEIFMGYRKYYLFYLKQLLQQRDYGQLLNAFLGFQRLLLAELPSVTRYWQQRSRYNKKQQTTLLRLPAVKLDLSASSYTEDPCSQRQIADVLQWSLPSLLRYEDRNSMGNSIESRLPLLDYRLVELGLALPTSLKLNKGYGKWVVRKLMQDVLPDTIRLARYKRGFDVLQKDYIVQGLGAKIRNELHSNLDRVKNYLPNYATINTDFSDHQLMTHPKRLSEALNLLWLINPYGEYN